MKRSLWLLSALGCAPREGETDSPCVGSAPELRPGTGSPRVVALADGDPITLVSGAQGGWHIELGGEVARVGPDVEVHATLLAPDLGDLQLSGQQPPTLLSLEGYDPERCSGFFVGLHALVDPQPGYDPLSLVCALEGQSLSLSLSLVELSSASEGLEHEEEETSGRGVSAVISLEGALDPADVLSCR